MTELRHGAAGASGVYDPRRNEVVTPRGRTYVRELDAHWQTRRLVEPGGASTTYRYGAFGRLDRVDLPLGAFRAYTYDSLGLVHTVHDSSIGVERFERDGFGEVFEVVRADGASTAVRRDGAGRVTRRASVDGVARFVYDTTASGMGLLGRSVAEDGTTETYDYDGLGRLQHATRTVGALTMSAALSYDPASGRLSGIRAGAGPGGLGSGAGLRFGYRGGHLTEVSSEELGGPIWEALAYHPQGFVSRERYPDGGLEVERDLDATDRRVGLRSRVQELDVMLDADGHVVSVADGLAPVVGAQAFEYDERGRLDRWSWPGTAWETRYAYDDLGNVLRTESATLAYHPRTRQLSAVDGAPVAHDARGRVESSGGRRLTWRDSDLFDEVQEESSGANVRFAYTAGRERAGWSSSSGESSFELGSLYRRDVLPSGVRETFGVPGGGRQVAELTSEDGRPLEVRYVHDDHLGSTAAVSEPSGAVRRFWYSPFGRRVDPSTGAFVDASSGFGEVRPRFAGHAADGQEAALGERGAGFIHMLGREYDPVSGRMLTPDPMTPVSGEAGGWNAYAYVLNDPSTLVDPDGFGIFDVLFFGGHGIVDLTSSAALSYDRLVHLAEVGVHALRDSRFNHQQAEEASLRDVVYEGAGVLAGLGVPGVGPSRHATERHQFFYLRGQMLGSAVGAAADIVVMAAGMAMIVSGESLPLLGSILGPEGTALGAAIGIPAWVIGAGLVNVAGGVLTQFHGPQLAEALQGLDRFPRPGLAHRPTRRERHSGTRRPSGARTAPSCGYEGARAFVRAALRAVVR
ncbi:MAG: RHS repeat-associated core domain-containing protein [Sandaracinaceae bacterium]|nr:RHS repeat-associated core domain-containing protein [Sandaracinaceae bacterium]